MILIEKPISYKEVKRVVPVSSADWCALGNMVTSRRAVMISTRAYPTSQLLISLHKDTYPSMSSPKKCTNYVALKLFRVGGLLMMNWSWSSCHQNDCTASLFRLIFCSHISFLISSSSPNVIFQDLAFLVLFIHVNSLLFLFSIPPLDLMILIVIYSGKPSCII